jgi:hypothetical protein
MTTVIRFAVFCAISIGLAACADSPQPTMHLRPVRQVNLDMMPSRTVPQTLTPADQ